MELAAGRPGRLSEARLRRALYPILRRAHALLDCGPLLVDWAIDAQGRPYLLQVRPSGPVSALAALAVSGE